MRVYTWDSIETEPVTDAITRQMFWGENIMVTRWELKPFTVLPEHSHVSEQVTMLLNGSATMLFPKGERLTLSAGDMIVIPANMQHGVEVGPEGALAMDLFSPIREDFISQAAARMSRATPEQISEESSALSEEEIYRTLHAYLNQAGVKASLEQLKEYPILQVARLAYERECLSLGRLRLMLGLDKKQAKDLLREWKHGDDHSEASYRKMMTQKVILPGELPREKKSD